MIQVYATIFHENKTPLHAYTLLVNRLTINYNFLVKNEKQTSSREIHKLLFIVTGAWSKINRMFKWYQRRHGKPFPLLPSAATWKKKKNKIK